MILVAMALLVQCQVPELTDAKIQYEGLTAILKEKPSAIFQYWRQDKDKTGGGIKSSNHLFCIDGKGNLSKDYVMPDTFRAIRVSEDYHTIAGILSKISRERNGPIVIGVPYYDEFILVANRSEKLFEMSQEHIDSVFWRGSSLRILDYDEQEIKEIDKGNKWERHAVRSPFKEAGFRYSKPYSSGSYLSWDVAKSDAHSNFRLNIPMNGYLKVIPLPVTGDGDVLEAKGSQYFFFQQYDSSLIYEINTQTGSVRKLPFDEHGRAIWLEKSQKLACSDGTNGQIIFYSPSTGLVNSSTGKQMYFRDIFSLNGFEVVANSEWPGDDPTQLTIQIIDSNTGKSREVFKADQRDVYRIRLMSVFDDEL